MFSLFHVYWGQRQSYVLWACIEAEPAVAVGTLFFFFLGALVIQQILGNIHVAGAAPPGRRPAAAPHTPHTRGAALNVETLRRRTTPPLPLNRRRAAPSPQCSSASTPRPATAFSAARPPPVASPPSPLS
jgi:hypothetical protein